jgi:hypothetical protein
MKVKLWEVYGKHKNPMYWGSKDSKTVSARNIDEALRKGKKKLDKEYSIYKIEWLASED